VNAIEMSEDLFVLDANEVSQKVLFFAMTAAMLLAYMALPSMAKQFLNEVFVKVAERTFY
jgi:hypothetical protein